MSVFFRPLEEITWREGKVENISRSGVLFRTSKTLEAGTRIEMRFDLPAEVGGEPAAHVVCAGEVTRVVPASTPGEPPLLAASIADYHFLRGAAGEGDA